MKYENANVNIVCMLQWFGPFKDREQCRNQILDKDKAGASLKEFNFYLICGKEPQSGVKKESFYCGITRQKQVFKRFEDPEHPSNNLHVSEIRIARFSEERLRRLTPEGKIKTKINKIIEEVEHGLINYLSQLEELGMIYFRIKNDKKTKSQPKDSMCIINQWYDIHRNNKINQTSRAQKWLSDVIYYDKYEGTGMWKNVQRLKLLKR